MASGNENLHPGGPGGHGKGMFHGTPPGIPRPLSPLEGADPRGPRIFSSSVKEGCWNAASPIPGRDPARWRFDRFGQPIMKPLKNCFGPLCYEFDHRVPYSKGGASVVENCDVLTTCSNRLKSNKDWFTPADQVGKCTTHFHALTSAQMDFLEEAIFGDVHNA